jgi:hypothetical protein
LFTNALLGAYQQFLLKAKNSIPSMEPLVLNKNAGNEEVEIATSEATGETTAAVDSAAQLANSEEESGIAIDDTPEAKPEKKLSKKEGDFDIDDKLLAELTAK